MYEVWIDGACKHRIINEKKMSYGYSTIGVVIKENGKKINEYYSYIGDSYDNNQTEYEALIYAIDKILELNISSVTFYTDSNLVEKQINDKYGVYAQSIIPCYMKAKKMIQMIPEWKINLIKREQNKEADKLTRIALKEFFAKENKL